MGREAILTWNIIQKKLKYIKIHSISNEVALNERAKRMDEHLLQKAEAARDMVCRASASKIGSSCDLLKLRSVVISSEAQVLCLSTLLKLIQILKLWIIFASTYSEVLNF